MYTKSGDLGRYSSIIVLSPDHNIGFSVLAADGAQVAATVSRIADVVAGALLPTVQDAAKRQAGEKFAGVYRAVDNGTVGAATEIELVLDDNEAEGGFGLRVKSWYSEGRDMFASVLLTQGAAAAAMIDPSLVAVRLFPTGLEAGDSIAWRAIFGLVGKPDATDIFSLQCASWTTVDALEYGARPLDRFVFRTGNDGKAVALVVSALGTELVRV